MHCGASASRSKVSGAQRNTKPAWRRRANAGLAPEFAVTWARAVLGACAIVYLAVSLDHLGVFPAVGEDEPWIAAAPYKLATEGVYGSDLFAGYYGVERHNYQHMPLYPLLQAGVFKVAGVGVFQMRLLPVLFGLALLVVVFIVGRALGDERVGALAAVLLITLRVADGGDATGILLLDRARINRYDIAVPVFGLLALWAFARAGRAPGPGWYLLAGTLTALASLSHLFGVFWLPILLALLVVVPLGRVGRVGAASLIVIGFLVPWVPWLLYIATGWDDYRGQMLFVASRFDLLNVSFYLDNTLHGGPISIGWMVQTVLDLPWHRIGSWTVVLGIPLALAAMAWSARQDRRGAVWLLGVAAVAQFVMFLTLLSVKTDNYMIGLWPLGALLLAWFAVWSWDRGSRLLRSAVAIVLTLILIEGGTRIAHAQGSARRIDNYDAFAADIARCIPAGSRVLGLQHYWLGLRQYPYRTWLMAVNLAHPLYYHDPMTLDAALDRIDPDIILVDFYMGRFLRAAADPDHPSHRTKAEFDVFLARRSAKQVCTIENRTYGSMIVYRVPK